MFAIDIVAPFNQIIYLLEVKTRKNADFGGGEGAINAFKLHKMRLATEAVLKKYPETEIKLGAVFVTGQPDNFTISELIEID